MYNMNSNVFSLSEKIIISDKSFTRLNLRLKELGFVVEEISYMETSKWKDYLDVQLCLDKRMNSFD